MKLKYAYFIFLFVFILRIYLAFQTPFSYDAYLNLDRMQHTAETGELMLFNDLSFGGNEALYLPLFYYILAFFIKFFSIELVAKVLPNLFISSIVIIIYAIVKHITENEFSAIFSSLISGFIPVSFIKSLNSVSVESLAIPLIFLSLYFFMLGKLKINHYIVFMILLMLTSSYSIILVIGFLVYLGLLKIANLLEDKESTEIIIFTTLILLWFNFLVYRDLIIDLGFDVIWKNLPFEILSKYFLDINILTIVFQVGIVPLLCGLFIMYMQIFKDRNKDVYLVMSFALTSLVLLWFKLIKLDVGLYLFGLVLAILFGVFIKSALFYFSKTKAYLFKGFFIFGFFLLILFTSIIPSVTPYIDYPPNDLIQDLKWIRDNTPQNSKVLGNIDEGHIINYIAERKNVFDNEFYFIENPNQYMIDISIIYTTRYMTDSIRLLEEYGVDYILFTDETRNKYGVDEFNSFDEECFEEVRDSIFQVKCKIGESK